ncbi:MAG: hypothetical protein DME22_00160 [Verrucomicrobia bacterium]|nr:MAG: hypothetical protein DME22_00160 [Verrucomicrobiota bacterium]
MPDEPNRNVEDQLKTWAQKRREEAEAPFELHPATRKMLQDEVARTFPKKSGVAADVGRQATLGEANHPPPYVGGYAGGWLKMFWPRFALVGSLCVALVAVVGILLPGLARSKSKAQQVALAPKQEKAWLADSERRDASAKVAPSSSSRAVEAPVNRLGEVSVKAVESSAAQAVPALAENKPAEQEVLVQSEPKDARLKKADQPAKDETRKSPETSRSLELSYAERAKEAAPSEGRPDSRDRGAGPVNGRNRLLMERNGLAPRRAETGAVVPADKQAAAAQAQAPTVANAQVTLEAANVGRNAGVGGGGFGVAAATNQVALNETGQQYAQVRRYRVNFNSPPMPNVLRSFEVEQSGKQLRVVDADGSIYDGAIEGPENEEFAKRVVAAQTAQADLKKKVEPEARRVESVSETAYGETAGRQNVFFHVAGTNRTLNQLVVFQGNFLTNTNQTSAILLGARLAADKPTLVPQQSPPLQIRSQLPNSLIQGQATIGDRNRVQINASPVGP